MTNINQEWEEGIREEWNTWIDTQMSIEMNPVERKIAGENWWLNKFATEKEKILREVLEIVRKNTTQHVTREYRDTDLMRDKICKDVSLLLAKIEKK